MSSNTAPDRIDAVIFDCDGTLVDSETLSAKVALDMLAEHGVVLDYEDMLARNRGRQFARIVDELRAAYPHAVADDFIEDFRTRTLHTFRQHLQPIAGAVALVEALHLPMCVASNAPRAKIEACLEITGMLSHFQDRIVSAYEVGAWKPDPALVLAACALFDLPPERCLLVEDSVAGVEAGIAAGVHVLAYRIDTPGTHWPSDRVRLIDDLADVLTRVAA
ncbi:HAD-IA family hydrolase [Pigmentiphaga aceris]|uniref:HAD-IA family hydrolase n=1 Tax=Pigmentiphaga aceris TaxID=1940612 RepID=A0A5C0AZE9_9BURK|nr:HAD-IA family hydrolase [Pigmentiphaga aceris]QEI05961.1 HAD-IA family hydrolase [Pigmentiphaga aceris]